MENDSSMRQHPKYSNPYYWAGFIMYVGLNDFVQLIRRTALKSIFFVQ